MFKHRALGIYGSFLALPLLAVACQSNSNSSPSSAPPTTRLRLESTSGVFASAMPAQLKATFAGSPMYEFGASLSGPKGDSWSATARLSGDQILGGHAIVSAATGGNGTARIARSGSEVVIADSGVLDLQLAGGKLTGTVSVSPELLNGAISGDLLVTCWVSAAELGKEAPIGGGTSTGDALLLDETMQTASCAPLRALAKP